MKNKLKRNISLIVLFLLFFTMVPLLQSLLFSSKSHGVITINEPISLEFIDSNKSNILIYFGYVGCADICTPFLYKLSHLYESETFKELQKDTEFFFINLNPNIEPAQADQFAKFFHEEFHGVYLTKKELFQIDKNFSLFFSDSLSDATEINHTDYLYLIKNIQNEKILHNIYFTHPLSSEKLIDGIITTKDNINE